MQTKTFKIFSSRFVGRKLLGQVTIQTEHPALSEDAAKQACEEAVRQGITVTRDTAVMPVG